MLTQAEKGNVEKNREAAGNRTQVAGLSRQGSNHWATTTHSYQFSDGMKIYPNVTEWWNDLDIGVVGIQLANIYCST